MNTREHDIMGELDGLNEQELKQLALLVEVFCLWKVARGWVLGVAFVCAALVGFNPWMAFPALTLAGLSWSPWPVLRVTSLILRLA